MCVITGLDPVSSATGVLLSVTVRPREGQRATMPSSESRKAPFCECCESAGVSDVVSGASVKNRVQGAQWAFGLAGVRARSGGVLGAASG